jgi:hypothetical protein
MIYGPKEDGTYVVEFKTAPGEAPIPRTGTFKSAIPRTGTFKSGCRMGCSCRRCPKK